MRKTAFSTALTAALALAVLSAHTASAAGMMWSTFLGGGSTDQVNGTATDAAGNIYVVGTTSSANFPMVGGGFVTPRRGYGDVMVAKISADGRSVMWSAILGGTMGDEGRGVAVDRSGNVFVTGYTLSSDFSTTPGAYRTSSNGQIDGFVAKLSPAGGLMFSTYLGGAWQDWGYAIQVDSNGNPVVAGFTESVNFPTTPGVIRSSRAVLFTDVTDGFVTKLDPSGTRLIYSTYLGGTNASDAIIGMVLNSSDQPVVTGWTFASNFPTTPGAYDRTKDAYKDGFVATLNADATGLVFSSYLGGNNADEARAVGVDAAGNVYVTGFTASAQLRITSDAPQRNLGGGWDAFLAKFTPTGNALAFSTYLGGAGYDKAYGMSVSPQGEVTITGETDSNNFPTSAGAFDATANGGIDAFIARYTPTGQLAYSSYLGSSGTDRGFSLAGQGSILVLGGQTTAPGFPSTVGLFDNSQNSPGSTDGFVSCWSFGSAASMVAATPQAVNDGVRAGLQVLSAAPNPFRDRTHFGVSLAQSARVILLVRDLQGRLVKTISDGVMTAGSHQWTWDGCDADGRAAAPGVYLVNVAAGTNVSTRTITLIR